MPGHRLQSKGQAIASHSANHEEGSAMSDRLLWVLEAASSASGNTALTHSHIRSHQTHQERAL